ncbi:MAG TPA: hypothetical protein PLA90_07180 [Candidatus Sumerlaeota bacterium]|nr:hypothetical protein [Candidatus Sumerlaeota bacterium]
MNQSPQIQPPRCKASFRQAERSLHPRPFSSLSIIHYPLSIRPHVLPVWACLLLLLAAPVACHRAVVTPPEPPHETLLLVVAEFRRYAETDLYRYETPKDISGQNVFRALAAKLAYFEQNNPGVQSDVVEFTRGEALLRLADYRGALDAFNRVAAQADSPLAAQARERIEVFVPVREALLPPREASNMGAYFNDLEARRERLAELEKQRHGSYDAILIRRELERADTEYALALFRNRFVLPDGSKRALDFARGLLDRHANSARVNAHRLQLGQFYAELARDLASLQPPDRAGFQSDLFHQLATAAQKEFLAVSKADGYEEKLEAKAQLDALNAFLRKVRKMEQ